MQNHSPSFLEKSGQIKYLNKTVPHSERKLLTGFARDALTD
jgi:hypothetical protein